MRISRSKIWKSLPACCLILLAGCATPQPPATVRTTTTAAASHQTADDLAARHLAPEDALLIGAGDIADCRSSRLQHAKDTAAIIQKFSSATVFAAGDDAYENGTDSEFRDCYGQSWGGFKDRTRPAPGNHDYGIPARRFNADPYFQYFGTAAGPADNGFYSYDLGGWHLVSLNSMAGQRGAPKMADQVAWLSDDLARTEKKCVLAYWHHPLFSSGDAHGDDPNDPGRSMAPLWDVLLKHKADVILNGHDHHYERFALQDAAHRATPNGIREIIVGTGGGEDRGLGTVKANSQVRLPHVYGVLLMTLHPNGYEWHFIDVNGKVRDQGSSECH